MDVHPVNDSCRHARSLDRECELCPPGTLGAEARGRTRIDGAGFKGVMKSPKTPLELLTPEFLEGIAQVLLVGAQKYDRHNWVRGMSWETVLGGVMRHVMAFRRGEEMDPETGLSHLHHAACGLMFLSWYANGPQHEEYRRLDDRAFKAS